MVYLAIPIDLIPDLVPILGYADDAIIVVAVLSSVVRQVGIDQVRAHWTGTDDGFNALCKAAVPTGSRSGSNGSTGPPPPIRPRVIQTRSGMEGVAVSAQRVGAVGDLPAGKVIGVGRYAVGNADGRYFAVTRRCRHLGADLAAGSIDDDGCLVCPLHHSAYDVETGRMVRGPPGDLRQGARPGLRLPHAHAGTATPAGTYDRARRRALHRSLSRPARPTRFRGGALIAA
jgi:nitrite reductase/ring-hydroxylating ferredoxin subunit